MQQPSSVLCSSLFFHYVTLNVYVEETQGIRLFEGSVQCVIIA